MAKKSPAYGSGRNFKHMKGPKHPAAGSHNLKGKKSKVLSCGCCAVEDYRDELIKAYHEKDIEEVYYEQ